MTPGMDGYPPVSIVAAGMICPDAAVADVRLPPGSQCESFPAFMCPARPSSPDIPAGVLRRLGRAQRMAMVAAHEAVRHWPEAARGRGKVAVAVGTGLAETGQTASFLENMIEMNEAQPRPARFVNSVHNSIASQIAIALKCTGENHTFSHGFISFELALWQGMQTIRSGRADHVVVCGVDEVSPYLVSAGLECGWWTAAGAGPEAVDGPGGNATLLGEGAAAFLLATETGGQASPAPRLGAVSVRPLPGGSVDSMEPGGEIDFIQRTLASSGTSLDEVDIVLVGTNGRSGLDAAYNEVLAAMASVVGRPVRAGAYKGVCGEFCTAAAIALALASEAIRGGKPCPHIREITPMANAAEAPSKVLLYHLYPTGHHSAILVTR